MVQLAACVVQTSLDVLRLQISQLGENLLGSQPVGQKIQDIHHTDAHAADARASTALLVVESDALHNQAT